MYPAAPALVRDDLDLVCSAQGGDKEALEQLLRRHRRAIERLCRRLCRGEESVDDVMQETFVAILRNLASFRGDAGFLTWVYTIARTHRGRAMRSARSSRDRVERYAAARLGSDEGVDLDEVVFGREVGEAMWVALSALGELDRAVLVHRDIEGRSAAETATVLGLTVSAVKARLHRARVTVRATLEQVAPPRQPALH